MSFKQFEDISNGQILLIAGRFILSLKILTSSRGWSTRSKKKSTPSTEIDPINTGESSSFNLWLGMHLMASFSRCILHVKKQMTVVCFTFLYDYIGSVISVGQWTWPFFQYFGP